ncbi:NAD-dependent epimerase/dehydratase family protein [Candidatus Babeliales bacterium]|nr:NAD-dependent epimerase/dehydratase family protein [Candidatus Babeliales bacterium]
MVKWITPFLGTTNYQSIPQGDYFLVDARELLDGPNNGVELVRSKVEAGTMALKEGRSVIVFCHYGISRSNAIATGILAQYKQWNFNQALEVVFKEIDESNIDFNMLQTVRDCLQHKPYNHKNILITGAHGFLGKRLHAKLQKEMLGAVEVHGIDVDTIDLCSDRMRLNQFVHEKEIEKIIHLAHPFPHNAQSTGNALCMLQNLLEVVHTNGLKMIFTSSWVVYENSSEKNICEKTALAPKTIYGMSKALCEHLISYYRKLYNANITIARLSPIYSTTKMPGFMSTFFEYAAQNKTIRTHLYENGSPAMQLLHVDDAINALFQASQHTNLPNSLNVSTHERYSVHEIAHMIKEIGCSKSAIQRCSMMGKTFTGKIDPSNTMGILDWKPNVRLQDGLTLINKQFQKETTWRKRPPTTQQSASL